MVHLEPTAGGHEHTNSERFGQPTGTRSEKMDGLALLPTAGPDNPVGMDMQIQKGLGAKE